MRRGNIAAALAGGRDGAVRSEASRPKPTPEPIEQTKGRDHTELLAEEASARTLWGPFVS
jgi:hypothetical protein